MMTDLIAGLGRASVPSLWLPTAAWTVVVAPALLWLAWRRRLPPISRYRLAQALLFALPATVLATPRVPGGIVRVPPAVSGVEMRHVVGPNARGPTPIEPATAQASEIVAAEVGRMPVSGSSDAATRSDRADDVPPGPPDPAPAPSDPVGLALGLATLAALALLALRLAILAAQLHSLRRLRRAASPVIDRDALHLLARLRAQLGVRRGVALLEGPNDGVPITFGWHAPAIVVPAAMARRPEELKPALVHELVHVGRSDFAWAVAERLVRALYSFHPAVWALGRSIDRDRESSCDGEVVATGLTEAGAYAHLLFTLGSRSQARLGVAAGLATPASHLKERLETMKHFAKDMPSRKTRRRSTLAAGAVLVLTTSLGACLGGTRDVDPSDVQLGTMITSEFGDLSDGARAVALERLGAQIAYLEQELAPLDERMRSSPPDWTRRDRARFQLLNDMYEQRLRTFELMRMEEAVAAVTRR